MCSSKSILKIAPHKNNVKRYHKDILSVASGTTVPIRYYKDILSGASGTTVSSLFNKLNVLFVIKSS